MNFFARFRSCPIQRQIKVLAIWHVVAVGFVVAAVEIFAPGVTIASATVNRIVMVVAQMQSARTPEEAAKTLADVARTGPSVEIVPVADLEGPSGSEPSDAQSRILRELPSKLEAVWREHTSGALHDVVVVRLDSDRALAFGLPPPAVFWLRESPTLFLMKVMAVVGPVILLWFYANRAISAPLLRFAAAASKYHLDRTVRRPFAEEGAEEMVLLARALNDMRARVHAMIDDRTRMLRAISHDLRTPLTRLKLRAERCSELNLREALLRDIVGINDMIEETLAYLSNEVSMEKLEKADLPSLLETVCVSFSNIGFDVTYLGPQRLAHVCKPRALARIVTNLVDNGTKFAGKVTVSLLPETNGAVRIDVSDNGPGLPSELKAKVLEPFYKADAARPAGNRSGFGLGLSIVDELVRSCGGTLTLLDAEPSGLIVRLQMPAMLAIVTAPERPERSPNPGERWLLPRPHDDAQSTPGNADIDGRENKIDRSSV
ncbi:MULTISPECIES: ATP-binding protein [Rhodopseudomonas]|uniref:ATP-binding protein n=1 Tax=Rhodopseudomonas TaxID=1073 RepID=UPI0006969F46|nr:MULTISPECIES: ATP-binding protein [Rhodopseudomonas]MDF3812474.1 ATP-binding protein [Rhodopseudomonas sp. BAL398]WOK19472.1 ATP-binding protein [Rhodopseudomonas sp. BAL398]